jgi:hypothetical protein
VRESAHAWSSAPLCMSQRVCARLGEPGQHTWMQRPREGAGAAAHGLPPGTSKTKARRKRGTLLAQSLRRRLHGGWMQTSRMAQNVVNPRVKMESIAIAALDRTKWDRAGRAAGRSARARQKARQGGRRKPAHVVVRTVILTLRCKHTKQVPLRLAGGARRGAIARSASHT